MNKNPIPFRVVKNVGKNKVTVILSPMGEEDYISYAEWMNDFDITKFLGRSDKAISYAEQKEWVERQHGGNKAAFGIWVQPIEGEAKLVGNCSLTVLSNNTRTAILGIVIGNSAYRGQGIGSAVVGLLLELAFLDMNLHSVNLTVVEGNEQAIKCYEKNGFVKQGIMRDRSYYDGSYHNEVYMDILREEWKD
jgi:RimJ/RimL family protein N-acetyltransferase